MGLVTDVDYVNNLAQVKLFHTTGTVSPHIVPVCYGTGRHGMIFQLDAGDMVFVADTDGFHYYIIGVFVPVANREFPTDPEFNYAPPNQGEVIIYNESGAKIDMLADGTIYLLPAPGKPIILGGQTNVAPVARHGDAVVNGHIVASTINTLSA